MIHAVRISSPGLISFDGIPGVIEQLRELFKDLSWRNRHERRIAEVAYAKERLELLREYQALQQETGGAMLDAATLIAAQSLGRIQAEVGAGRLLLPDDERPDLALGAGGDAPVG
jgi:hypothetical protein